MKGYGGMESQKPFELVARRWYAMLRVMPDGEQYPSPIWVFEARGLQTGKGLLEVEFWHANYPEGVQQKVYALRVLARERGFLVGQRQQEKGEDANREVILLSEVTPAWMETHFRQHLAPGVNVQAWLDRIWGRP